MCCKPNPDLNTSYYMYVIFATCYLPFRRFATCNLPFRHFATYVICLLDILLLIICLLDICFIAFWALTYRLLTSWYNEIYNGGVKQRSLGLPGKMYFDASLKKIKVTNFKTIKPLKQNDAYKRDLFFKLTKQKRKKKNKKEYKWSGTSQLNDTTCFVNLVVKQVSMILDRFGNVHG